MFAERLQSVADRIEGSRALTLVAHDGIPIESVTAGEDLDLEQLAAELMSQVHAVDQNHRELSMGGVRHLAVTSSQVTLMIQAVAHRYYLMAVLDPTTALGKARFELRRAALLFEDELL